MAHSSKPVTPLQMIIGIAMWLGVALIPIVFEITEVRLAFGQMGTPGRVTVTSCTDSDTSAYCSGTFTPKAPPSTPINVTLRADSKEDDVFPAQLHPDGIHAYPTDFGGRASTVAIPALGILILVPLPWALAYKYFRHIPGKISLSVMGVLAAIPAGVTLVGLAMPNF
ncbi:hypothetical protein [Actinomadura sp. 3N508]|uniref:hypothetical protein n=1 Tax=Actinomadura sp. 3N508 TaxID=3375153 RepID=UPI0037A7E862